VKQEPVHYAQAMKERPAQQEPTRPQPDAQQLPAFLLRPVKLPKAPEKPVRAAKPKTEQQES
jgi:hypothetical protein